MGLIEQEINELRTLLKDYKAGTVNDDNIRNQIAIYSQTEKRIKMMLQAITTAAKYKGTMKKMQVANFIGEGTAIDLTLEESEAETIRCPNTGNLIKRSDCLDYSGQHDADCQNCSHREKTVKALIDNV